METVVTAVQMEPRKKGGGRVYTIVKLTRVEHKLFFLLCPKQESKIKTN